MWPIIAHVDYRLSLEAPASYAGAVLGSDLGRFSPGPLTEVAASTHTWAEIAPHIDDRQSAAYVAQERVLRGEDLTDDPLSPREVLEMPMRIESFEPTYTLATYRSNLVEVPEPWEPKQPMRDTEVTIADEVGADSVVDSLLDVVQPWVTESNGAARAVVVEGDHAAAIGTVTPETERVLAGPLLPDEALQRLAWAAASGGAHGRRRGAAFGRFTAFFVIATVAGLGWPSSSAEIGRALKRLSFYRWDENIAEEGWIIRIAIADETAGWAAALAATDLKEDETEL